MPPALTVTNIRLTNIITNFTATINTLEILSDTFQTPFLNPICLTGRSILTCLQNVQQHKNECFELMEQTHGCLLSIITLHLESNTGGELPPIMIKHIGNFTQTLHKINAFVEAQQHRYWIKNFFRSGEVSKLMKDCNVGLQDTINNLKVQSGNVLKDITEMQRDAATTHQEVLELIASLSQDTASDGESSINRTFSTYSNSSTSIGIFPSEPKIFHGRDLELSKIVQLFAKETPRIAILGAGGIGKTNNFETLWEPVGTRKEIEDFLSLLTEVPHLALIITMRGAERPSKVHWTRPFLPPLQPLTQVAARKTFSDIADSNHDSKDIDKILLLTGNVPLAINLLAHLVDSEGCSNVLSRWEQERTSLISKGYDRRSNLDLSISLSLSSSRLVSDTNAITLLSLLSILPDGLLDSDFQKRELLPKHFSHCKATLLRTSLAYKTDHGRVKTLVPIQEYMQKFHPVPYHLFSSLLKYYRELLEVYDTHTGMLESSAVAVQISSNLANITSMLSHALSSEGVQLLSIIESIIFLNDFSQLTGQGESPLMSKIANILPMQRNHRLEARMMLAKIKSWKFTPNFDPEVIVHQILEHFDHFEDSDLKARVYTTIGSCYRIKRRDVPAARTYFQAALSLAKATGNSLRQSQALHELAFINWQLGDYSGAQKLAYESQRIARNSGSLAHESRALVAEATCWEKLGNYRHTISLLTRARHVLTLCGMSGGETDLVVMSAQAEVYKFKSEYMEANRIYCEILRQAPFELDSYRHAWTLLNMAEIDVAIGAPSQNVQRHIDVVISVFDSMRYAMGMKLCDTTLADLHLREGNTLEAERLFKDCMQFFWKFDNVMITHCLERFANAGQWGHTTPVPAWSTVFLVHSLKSKDKLAIFKSFKFLGDVFHAQGDQETAIALLSLALEEFTLMDVHRSRAECMLQLGNISAERGDLLKASELWKSARPLFECSSQAKHLLLIDEKLAQVSQEVTEHHAKKTLVGLLEVEPDGSLTIQMQEMDNLVSVIENDTDPVAI
ncbi:hypothetical protein B0H13DRAFT_2278531 [Mycena leptocephala]|nr:hypothetical protein B0H13DRAFT_2278531 [Mycena leptocephala]